MRKDDPEVVFDCKYGLRKYKEDQLEKYEVGVFLEGFEVMRVLFIPDNLKTALLEKYKRLGPFLMLSKEERDRVAEVARERLAQQGVADTRLC